MMKAVFLGQIWQSENEKSSKMDLNFDVEQSGLQIRIRREKLHTVHMSPGKFQKWSIFVKMGRLIFSSFFQKIFFEVGVDMGVFEVAEAESDFRFWRRLSPSEIWPKKNEKWSEMDQKWDVE